MNQAQHLPALARSARAGGEIATYPFFPQAGVLWGDLFFSNFTDRQAGTAAVDFNGGSATYDGHRGIDSNILTWDQQDAGIPVFAALDGMVIDAHDGEADRNTSWEGQPSNYVVISHSNGHVTRYLHLKKDSVSVATGETVSAGQQIALTGSSGISTGPHLHFQTEIDGAAIEPFTGPQRTGKSMWQFQPDIVTATYVREFTLVPTSLAGWTGPPEPTTNTGTFVRSDTDQTIFLWWHLINRPANTTYTLTTRRPNGSIASFTSGSFEAPSRTGWIWRARSLLLDEIGTWHVDLAVNDEVLVHAPFRVVSTAGDTVNRPPNPAAFRFRKFPITADDVPVCEVATFTVLDDPDYDLVRYRYVWKVNGITQRDVTTGAKSDALARTWIARGATVRCEVTPMDSDSAAPTSIVETIVTETFPNWASRNHQPDDPAANPDNDTFPNLIEYVLDRSPVEPDAAPAVNYAATPARWNPSFPTRPPWANVWVDYSTDLHAWQPAIDDPSSDDWLTPTPAVRAFFRVTAQPLEEPPLTVDPSFVGPATP
ncbi:MAG: M23 family metallopeptidase [Verrucomicrobiae bacterium]|nr:M23 family metallopeptidase [Verrucomicrobiae bacterium]